MENRQSSLIKEVQSIHGERYNYILITLPHKRKNLKSNKKKVGKQSTLVIRIVFILSAKFRLLILNFIIQPLDSTYSL